MPDPQQEKLNPFLKAMIKSSFVCNSIKFKHFVKYFFLLLFGRGVWNGRKKFQDEIAAFFNISGNSVFLFGAARMGLFSILDIHGHRKNGEVIVAGFTCVVVTNAVKYAGLKAVYADIDPQNLNIRTQQLDSLINENTVAIVVTHNFGITYEDIQWIHDKYPQLIIIEDAAHTIGSIDQNGIKAGLLGDVSFFSLEYSKPITTGMGGFIIVNNDKIRERLQEYVRSKMDRYSNADVFRIFTTLKLHYITSYKWTMAIKWPVFRIFKCLNLIFKTPEAELQGARPEKYPVSLANSLALMGYIQFNDILNVNKTKAAICDEYEQTFQNIPGIKTYYTSSYNFVRYPVLLNENISIEKIKSIREQLRKAGITSGEWFNDVVHPAGSYRYCYEDGFCPAGESISKRILNLPVNIHARLSKADLRKVRQIFMQNLD